MKKEKEINNKQWVNQDLKKIVKIEKSAWQKYKYVKSEENF